jgi:hypothetical protein
MAGLGMVTALVHVDQIVEPGPWVSPSAGPRLWVLR